MADLFARTARRTLDGGILHGYRAIEEDLPLIRGRIRTSRQLRRAGLPLPVSVQYDDHTRDIAENQILLAALYRAAHIPGIGPTSRAQIRHLANRLTGVQPVRPGSTLPPESLLDAVTDLAAEVARDVRSTTASSVS
jgi:5-methylcytosine-specific restriction enzyme subunit McrC